MNVDTIFKQYAKKWKLNEGNVRFIYQTIDVLGQSKTRKIMEGFNINISPRQLRYFYKKANLIIRVGRKNPNISSFLKKI